jgi:hypothetical protein
MEKKTLIFREVIGGNGSLKRNRVNIDLFTCPNARN